MAERLNAAVLKTAVRDERTGGSNPSLSANERKSPVRGFFRGGSRESALSQAIARKKETKPRFMPGGERRIMTTPYYFLRALLVWVVGYS